MVDFLQWCDCSLRTTTNTFVSAQILISQAHSAACVRPLKHTYASTYEDSHFASLLGNLETDTCMCVCVISIYMHTYTHEYLHLCVLTNRVRTARYGHLQCNCEHIQVWAEAELVGQAASCHQHPITAHDSKSHVSSVSVSVYACMRVCMHM